MRRLQLFNRVLSADELAAMGSPAAPRLAWRKRALPQAVANVASMPRVGSQLFVFGRSQPVPLFSLPADSQLPNLVPLAPLPLRLEVL